MFIFEAFFQYVMSHVWATVAFFGVLLVAPRVVNWVSYMLRGR